MADTAAASSSSSSSLPKSSEVCKYYKLGSCIYGATCRFAHPDTPKVEASVPAEVTPSSPATTTTTTSFSSFTIDPLKWINAPEFIPKAKLQVPEFVATDEALLDEDADDEGGECDYEVPEEEDLDENQLQDEASTSQGSGGGGGLSYAAIVTMNNNHNGLGIIEHHPSAGGGSGVDSSLCPYYEASGVCMLEGCPYEHGDLCELCGKFCLNPADKEQQRQHNVECIKQHELDMEHSFAIQRSKDKICGICLEVILEKPGREQRFGILPNCNHIFCLECIRTWRKAKNFENKIKRGCPTCRISSDFVCPSIVWVEGPDDKDKLINDYKKACNTTHCKHFKQGQGKCPFGNKCFYKHALPCGQLVDVGGPSRQAPEPRLRISHLQDFFREVLHQRGRLLDDFMSSFFSDSDESELSELYDYYDI